VGAYACDTLRAEHGAAAASPLLADDLSDRVLVTPHIGAQTEEAVTGMGRLAVDNVMAVLDAPPHPLNRPGGGR
jgi:D-3-phosphoglycerate dehydrogenase